MIRVIFVLHTVQSQLCSCQRNLHMPTSTKVEIDWKAVGRRIREVRGFEVNQAGFAGELGVSRGQLSRYEQGSRRSGQRFSSA